MESQVHVLLALPEVEAAETVAVRHVVSRIPGPLVVPDQGNVAFSAHSLCAQCATGLLVRCLIKEVISKYTVVFLKTGSLQVVLY